MFVKTTETGDLSVVGSTEARSGEAPTLLEFANRTYMAYDMPIETSRESGTELCTSPAHRANAFLRRRLFSNDVVGPFRLMDLPPELRIRIFEFVLLLPQSGVYYDFRKACRKTTRMDGSWITNLVV